MQPITSAREEPISALFRYRLNYCFGSLLVLGQIEINGTRGLCCAVQRLRNGVVQLDDLCINGEGEGVGSQGAMPLFAPTLVEGTPESVEAAQQRASQQAPPLVPAALVLLVELPGMGQEQLPVRLLPGPPHQLQLLGGHCWATDAEGGTGEKLQYLPFEVQAGEQLPVFQVRSLRRWVLQGRLVGKKGCCPGVYISGGMN